MKDDALRKVAKSTTGNWLVAVAIFGAIVFAVLAIDHGPDGKTHEEILTALRRVDLGHAALQRDVLQARSRIVRTYGPLEITVKKLQSALARLQTYYARPNSNIDPTLRPLLDRLQSAIDADANLVRAFESQNDRLEKSVGEFGRSLSVLHSFKLPGNQWQEAPTSDIGNLMMQFTQHPDPLIARSLNRKFQRIISERPPPSGSYKDLATNGRAIVRGFPEINQTLRQIQMSATADRAQDLQDAYLKSYDKLSAEAALVRIFLGAVSATLCLYVAFLAYRLRFQTERLKRRLEFETMIDTVKRCFEGVAENDSERAVKCGMTSILEFFDARAFDLVILSTTDGEVQKRITGPDQMQPENWLSIADVVNELTRISKQESAESTLSWNLHRPDEVFIGRDGSSAGICVAVTLPHARASIFVLEYIKTRRRSGHDEIMLIEATLTTLVQGLEDAQKRNERKALERRLEHAERLQSVGTLAGGIAHEFNNILGAMLGYSEMSLKVLKKRSLTRHYVQEIYNAGQRAKHIIDQILSLSRRRERKTGPIDIIDVTRDIIPLLRVSLPDQIKLEEDLPEKAAVVVGNPIEIQQIIMNLAKNAAEAMSTDGTIGLSVRVRRHQRKRLLSHGELAPGDYVTLSISDTGSGICDSVLPHIFEPFFTTRSRAGGTGLGLATVHGYVNASKGFIDVSSREGVGTCFDIYLPETTLPPIPTNEFFDEAPSLFGRGELIAIVDSDAQLLLMSEEKVAALGYEPAGFATYQDLLNWIREHGRWPDLVILDGDAAKAKQSLADIVDGSVPFLVLNSTRKPKLSSEEATGIQLGLRKLLDSQAMAATLRELLRGQDGV